MSDYRRIPVPTETFDRLAERKQGGETWRQVFDQLLADADENGGEPDATVEIPEDTLAAVAESFADELAPLVVDEDKREIARTTADEVEARLGGR